MNKKIIALLALVCAYQAQTFACSQVTAKPAVAKPASTKSTNTPKPRSAEQIKLPASFTPTIHITQQLPEDLALRQEIKPLFFEIGQGVKAKRAVYDKAVTQYGAQEIMLRTDDGMRISTLYFKRPGAKLNLIYMPGYFFDESPTKEWATPFAVIFKEFNVLTVDWRSIGDSEGERRPFHKNAFGKNAYPDAQAAIDFMAKENNNPNVLIGFCFSAAMNMLATIHAHKTGRKTADALVFNCTFTRFENQFTRASATADNLFNKLIVKLNLAKTLLNYQANGSLFAVNPIEMMPELNATNIPCYFEHYTFDPSAIIEEGAELYQACTSPKMFLQSDLYWHVRIHSYVPYQYREAFLTFLRTVGLLERTI